MKTKIIKSAISICLSLCLCLIGIFPVYCTENDTQQTVGEGVKLNCKSAVLMEATTGQILYEHNPDEALPPASVTKVMTLLLVMEAIEEGKIKYTDMVRASANACSMGGSQIFLEENEEMSVDDLIKSVVIASANDAAVVLAEYIAGTEEAFVELMNKRAAELGMKNTSFENTNGLDDTVSRHLTSARDIAIMSRELIKHKKITEYSSIWMDSIRNGEFGLTNTNRLVRFYNGATGLKTGSTAKAGFCISATAERDGMSLICVIMGAESRDIRNATAVSLLDYGFANYGVYSQKGEQLNNIPTVKGTKAVISAEYKDFSTIVQKNEKSKIIKQITIPDKLDAPVKEGDVIGNVVYKIDEREIGRCDIIAKETSERLSISFVVFEILRKCAQIM